ncbi:serine protease 42-like isoform X1 [Scylla paramamosain]|uniref:serine protease 42-like isoform X1 n=1 Tax=Scylla paramamosain TaxID=85552 RepID=UPI0030829C92
MKQTRGSESAATMVPWKVVAVVLAALGFFAPVHGHFGSCEDHTTQCPRLASIGLCETRRQFMLQNCPVSCDACVDPNCFDRSSRCTPMAARGLCETQKSFMLTQCPHSCDACRIGQPTAVGFTNLKTIINPDFDCGRPYPPQAGRRKRQIYFPDEIEEIIKKFPPGVVANRRRPQNPRSPQAQEGTQPIVPLSSPATSGPASLSVHDTFCGSTPITDRFLLTAAHCVFDSDQPVRTVRLGELDFAREDEANARPVDYAVEQIIVHPDFDPSSLERYNDVALIKTVEPMQFNEVVFPFCLSDKAPTPGSSVTGAGFGLVNATHRPTQLQEADLEVLEASMCEGIFEREQFTPQLRLRYPQLLQGQSILCASFPERSACQGDSGGPLFMDRNNRRFLVGIVGSGVSCRANGISILPGLYINVADHIEFIDSVLYSPSPF